MYSNDFTTFKDPASAKEGVNAFTQINNNIKLQFKSQIKFDELKKSYPDATTSLKMMAEAGTAMTTDFTNWKFSSKIIPSDKEQYAWILKHSKYADFVGNYEKMITFFN